jgi:putative membrane protein
LSASDTQRVRQAVERAEASTAGEVCVVVTERSDDYAEVRSPWALAVTVLGGFLVYQAWPLLPAGWVFAVQAPLAVAIYWALGLPLVLRAIVPRTRQVTAVESKAKQLMLDLGVIETRDRSGVLILVSEAERRIRILADRGIHARVGETGWQGYVDSVVDAVRRGHAADGLCQVIESIGATLAEAFPPRVDDTNELPDDVLRVP